MLVCLRNSEEAGVAGATSERRRMADEASKVVRLMAGWMRVDGAGGCNHVNLVVHC